MQKLLLPIGLLLFALVNISSAAPATLSAAALERLLALRQHPQRQSALVNHARKMYDDRFHPNKIHSALVGKIRDTVEGFRP